MPFFIISHFFLIKVSLDIKMGLCFLEKKCHRISEISFLPSLKAKLLFPVCDGIPCTTVEGWVWKCKQKSFLIWWTSLIMTSTWGAIKEPGHVHSGSSVVVNASKSSTSIVLMSKLHKSCVDTCHIFHKPQ